MSSISVCAIEGYASVFNRVDEQNDRICPGAFIQTLAQRKAPKMLWQHQTGSPIGRWVHLQEDSQGLYVKGYLFMDLPYAEQAWSLVQHGILDGLSIGFHVQKASRCPKTGVRDLWQVQLLEISLVTFAAARPWTEIRFSKPSSVDPLIQQIQSLQHFMESSS